MKFKILNSKGYSFYVELTQVGSKPLLDLPPKDGYYGINTEYEFEHDTVIGQVTGDYTIEDENFTDRFSLATRIKTLSGDTLFVFRDMKDKRLLLLPNLDYEKDFIKGIGIPKIPYYIMGNWIGVATITAELPSRTVVRKLPKTINNLEAYAFLGSSDDLLGMGALLMLETRIVSFGKSRGLWSGHKSCGNLILELLI